jgi:gas vesicle protein
MRKFFAFLAGIFCGAIVGGATALLLAPMSGKDLQVEIADRVDQFKAEIETAVTEQEKRLRAEFERMKEEAAGAKAPPAA